MRLAELRELPVPPTTVAEGAWDRARGRRRRRGAATVAVAAILVGSTAVGIGVLRDSDDPTRPSPAPAPAPTTAAPTPEPTVTDLPDFAALARTVPALAATDPTYLSDDPVDRAVLAILPAWNGADSSLIVVDVLGADGRRRYVDVPGLVPTRDPGGYEGAVLSPTGLSPDGTHLVLPQPGRVIVVDLTTGVFEAYDVPGPNQAATWQDADHLVVSMEGATKSRVLDLTDGTVSASTFTAETGFDRDGGWVTWGRAGQLVSSDGTRMPAETANSGGLQLTSPLVDGEVAVGLGGLDLGLGRTTYKNVAGVPVVDRHSGALRAFLYTEGPDTGLVAAYLLGLDGDTVTVAVAVAPDYSKLLLVHWNWRTGAVTPVETVAAAMVSGTGE